MKNPKQKGNGFERQVAKLLSEWSGQEFHRTPQSGALHWENDKRVISDIVPPQGLVGWPFSIECKKVQNNWEFSTFLENTSQTIKEHWKQCMDDAQRECMVPMLVFTKNYHNIYALLAYGAYFTTGVKIDNIIVDAIGQKLVLFKFKDFLDKITLEELVRKKF